MPIKKKAGGVWDKPPVFVDLELSLPQKQALKKDTIFKERWYETFDFLSADGLKFSAKWDVYNDCGMATFTKDSTTELGKSLVYVMRASAISLAVFKLFYYYAVVSDRILPDARSKAQIEDDDLF
jgi:hypothetical protein